MKKLILTTLLVFFLCACLTLVGCRTNQIRTIGYNEGPIVKTYNLNGDKDKLFVDANRWMIYTFVSAKSVIQFSDKEEGVLIGKYLFKTSGEHTEGVLASDIHAIIEINVKDNWAKFSVNPDTEWKTTTKDLYMVKDMKSNTVALAQQFELYMTGEIDL